MITCTTNNFLKYDEQSDFAKKFEDDIYKMLNVDEDNYINDYYHVLTGIKNEIKIQNLFGWNDNRICAIKIIDQYRDEIKKIFSLDFE